MSIYSRPYLFMNLIYLAECCFVAGSLGYHHFFLRQTLTLNLISLVVVLRLCWLLPMACFSIEQNMQVVCQLIRTAFSFFSLLILISSGSIVGCVLEGIKVLSRPTLGCVSSVPLPDVQRVLLKQGSSCGAEVGDISRECDVMAVYISASKIFSFTMQARLFLCSFHCRLT